MKKALPFLLIIAVLIGVGVWNQETLRPLLVKYREGILVAQTSSPQTSAPQTQPTLPTQSPERPHGVSDRPQPVLTTPVERRPTPVRLTAIGAVQPIATVLLRSRIDSLIEAVHINDGQEVARGDLLYSLDARPIESQLRQSEAILERDRAQLEKSRIDVRRFGDLLRNDAVAREKYETALTSANVLEATVKADQANLDGIRLTLDYTKIRSPIAGRAGAILMRPGNVVRAGDPQPLVQLTQLRPIYAAFNIPERDLPAIRRAMATAPVEVMARIPGENGAEALGRLDFIDNAVDSQTGTIALKAKFDNTDTLLWPGQFVSVVITLRIDPQALTVPNETLQTSQQGTFVYVVRPDRTVEARPVTLDRSIDGRTVVTSGVKEGEIVVTEGQSRLRPGARVITPGANEGVKDRAKPTKPAANTMATSPNTPGERP
ncbi:membrane fusion protein, multidrug efflux system [Azospirillaceae bacterium]